MQAHASLRKLSLSARKARLVVDLIRGMQVGRALALLQHQPQKVAAPLHKLLTSALSNWQHHHPEATQDPQQLRISTIHADAARMLKRIRPAPQGRAHRIRKRSCHISLTLAPLPQQSPTPSSTA